MLNKIERKAEHFSKNNGPVLLFNTYICLGTETAFCRLLPGMESRGTSIETEVD